MAAGFNPYKRQRLDSATRNDIYGNPQLYTFRPSESTILIESGGKSANTFNNNFVGDNGQTEISGGLNGTTCVQYDDFFWMNDFFTFNPRNCLVGIYVTCWWPYAPILAPTQGAVTTTIIPIPIPWRLFAFAGFVDGEDPQYASSVQEGRTKIQRLREQLVYCLNLYFGGFNWPGNMFDYNMWCLSKDMFDQAQEGLVTFPIFQLSKLPPLRWVLYNGNTLALIRSSPYSTSGDYPYVRFGFRLVSIQSEWLTQNNFFNRWAQRFTPPYNSGLLQNSPTPTTIYSMLGKQNGWMGYSPNVTGFGDFDYNQSSQLGSYTDGLTDAERTNLFNLTIWVNTAFGSLPIVNITDWLNNYVYATKSNEYCFVAPRMCSLCPSKYYTIQSKTLTRNQKKNVVSNNSIVTSNTQTFGFIAYNGGNVDKGNYCQNAFPKSGINVNPVVDINPMEQKNIIDLLVFDEQGSFIRNNNYVVQFPSNDMTGCISEWTLWWAAQQLFQFRGNVEVPPAVYAAWNPDTVINPDNQSLIPYNEISQAAFFSIYTVGQVNLDTYTNNAIFTSIKNPSFNILCAPGSWLIHFTRVLGDV